ncbi:hypothetical protein P9A14_10710 [Gordonia hongkongensis]|uniref:Uncharacterized protein n=1 Tax=Gordonia hongkongensis TaxID=1701090 RepID=A0AAX3TC88_9ACTN|nr:hypothetical protein [Gordonia hongkongensis]QIK48228.1 hypothetical protein G8C36_14030 [Gordonia terrae]WFP26908.1 hypothetical protein P9A14_10710 [Gordonia hongkongensis]
MTDMNYPSAASADRRKAALAQAVSREVASAGWRVESQSEYQAVLAKGGNTNHVLHLIISVLTCGIWLFVWPFVYLANQRKTLVLAVDDYGNVLRQG